MDRNTVGIKNVIEGNDITAFWTVAKQLPSKPTIKNPNAFCDYCHSKGEIHTQVGGIDHRSGEFPSYPVIASQRFGDYNRAIAGRSSSGSAGTAGIPSHGGGINMAFTTPGGVLHGSGTISCSVVHNSPGYRWIVDTWATNHMVSTHELLYETQNSSSNESNKIVLILVYVDDLLITGSNSQLIQNTKTMLQAHFKIKDLGEMRYFLGLEIARNKEGIIVNQRKFTLDLISEFGMAGTKPVSTSLEVNQRFTSQEFDMHFVPQETHDDIALNDPTGYQKLIGKLLYLTMTRPVISYAVQNLSQFMHKPKKSHMDGSLRVVK
uniref:Reverse transcriptase Ty1/copia-type domain-containing protein n=1 Tax=Solanum lycopersicum TaxID=4081 RepID=A0A3Q7G220_SOLLC